MAARSLGRSIIECGRGNYGKYERKQRARGYRRWKLVDGEYRPGPRKGDGPELRDNLRPLQRWLKAQVGRPWDRIYSVFSAREDQRTLRGDHIHRHLKEMVWGVGGGRQFIGSGSPWMPLCWNLGVHGSWDLFVEDGILVHHTREDCWAWSNARGYFKPKPEHNAGRDLPKWASTKHKPEPYVAPRDPMVVLKERKLERNRQKGAPPES